MTQQLSFTETAWDAVADIRQAIDDHPFLLALKDGTLPRATFVGYLGQDAHYLIGYARALAMCAAQATNADDISFWASSAHDAVVVERSLHQGHVGDLTRIEPSPTCTAYLSFLLNTASQGCYPVLAAALTPCFWIYEDVGRRLKHDVELEAGLAGHPYGDWIATYGDPAFAAATERVKQIVDSLAEQGSEELKARMQQAFAMATRYEWMFWDAAWRGETWPVFGAANGSATKTATTKDAIEADNHG